ncbi:MAG: hypothetical protein UT21_C0006G0044 [Candidatus Woesebacteria bacterium GW2011_GWA1_39_11b]|nr:MAG: hypothetical protein UT21_C0006G0044 [Candidatus Woesebacteria bacterium GW2011_GWA1_39_11b]KKS77122.1 MAG: hypothetical protein UV51_C0010G0027 [Candidatus Woesebacteria bacterium GW2011_GWC1_42_9]
MEIILLSQEDVKIINNFNNSRYDKLIICDYGFGSSIINILNDNKFSELRQHFINHQIKTIELDSNI